MKLRMIRHGSAILAMLLLFLVLTTSGALAGEEKLPFALLQDKVIGKMPFGRQLYEASAKDGFRFLIVATTEMKKNEKISSATMNHFVIDSAGKEYKPIAFGMPHLWGDPFLVAGYSYEGDIASTDTDVERTYFALFYLVPKTMDKFTLKDPKGNSKELRVLQKWDCPKIMKTFGYTNYGKVSFGTPTVQEDGWGLK